MEELSKRCVETVRSQYAAHAPEQSRCVAAGRPTQRLSTLPVCFEEVSRQIAAEIFLVEALTAAPVALPVRCSVRLGRSVTQPLVQELFQKAVVPLFQAPKSGFTKFLQSFQ